MGSTCSIYKDGDESAVNSQIDKRLSFEIGKTKQEMTILLLGASESGKSTIFKQLRMYYGRYFSADEKKFFYNLIPENLISVLKQVVHICEDNNLPLNFEISQDTSIKLCNTDQSFKELFKSAFGSPKQIILSFKFQREFRTECGLIVSEFISKNSTAINQAIELGSDVNLPDSACYLIQNHSRIFEPRYDVPVNDILRARVSTTGVEEITISEHNMRFKILDVGGQRGERKKWIHVFEKKINIVLYVASLAEYDQKEPEDLSKARIEESIELFETIINSYFQNIPVILFLNKRDIFEQKLKTKPLKDYISNFKMENTVNNCIDFIRNLYVSKKIENKNSDGAIYSYDMEATNTEVFAIVWKVVKSLLFEKNLSSSGLIGD
eukprot:GAHX01001060.1.p1 GENE.GAHX01001060.1~~GAHX01001060.1.p1  ORF type:complete len:381 (-),score=75.01 GAHX01001060.1:30-1172(-)